MTFNFKTYIKKKEEEKEVKKKKKTIKQLFILPKSKNIKRKSK